MSRGPRYCLMLLLTLFNTSPVWPQNPTDNANPSNGNSGGFVDGLLRTMVDSRMNLDGPAGTRPAPVNGTNLASTEVRRLVDSFTLEASHLSTALQAEIRNDSNIRPLLSDVLRVRSTLDILNRRIQSGSAPAGLTREYRDLDQQWRYASQQIKQLVSVSAAVRRRVEAMDTINESLGQTFQVGPQMEAEDVVNLFAALASDLENLTEDVDLDLYANPNRDHWTRQLVDLTSRAKQLRMAVASRYGYSDVVRYYKQFYDAWMPLKRELRTADNRIVQRNVNRITKTNDRLHALLYLPPIIDGQDILYLAENLHRNVEVVSDQISLRQLIALENANDVLRRAKEFYGLSDEFRRVVAKETKLENIRWDFKKLDTAWFDLRSVITPVDDTKSNRTIALLDASLSELRLGLGLETAFDRDQAVDLVSQLDNWMDLLAYDVQRIVGRSNRYAPQVRDEALAAAGNLRSLARELHQSVAMQADTARFRNQFRQMGKEWQRLQATLPQLSAADRSELARSYQNIPPAMAKLQLLYAY